METTTKREPMDWVEIMHWIAQGAINIAEGHTTIHPGSSVHRAMEDLCARWNDMEAGRGKLPASWKPAAAHLAGYEPSPR